MFTLTATTHTGETQTREYDAWTMTDAMEDIAEYAGQDGEIASIDCLPDDLPAIQTDEHGYAATGSRPTSARRNYLARFLWDAAEHRCTVCGCETDMSAADNTPSRAVVMHIVPSGPRRQGWTPGNVVSACHACNAADGGRDLRPYVALFAGRASIPTSWPAGEVFTPTHARYGDEIARRRMARAARGIDY